MHNLVVLPNTAQPIEAGGGAPENLYSESPAAPSGSGMWMGFKKWLAGDIIEKQNRALDDLRATTQSQLQEQDALLQQAHEDEKMTIHAEDMRATLKKETRDLEAYLSQLKSELEKRTEKMTHIATCAKNLRALQEYETQMSLKKDPSVHMYTQIHTGDSNMGIFIATSRLMGYINTLERKIQSIEQTQISTPDSRTADRVIHLLSNPTVSPQTNYSLVWHPQYGWGKMKICGGVCPEEVEVKFAKNKSTTKFNTSDGDLKFNQAHPTVDLHSLRRDKRPWAQSTLEAWETRNNLASQAKQLHGENEARKTAVEEEEARLQEAWEAFQSKWIVVEPSEWNLNHQEATEFGPALKDVKLHARIMPCSDMRGAEC